MNTYPNQWDILTTCPEFLIENKSFGLIYIYDHLQNPISDGWTLIHRTNGTLTFENLGYDSKLKDELNGLKLFIETFFEKDLQLENNPSLSFDKNSLHIKVSLELIQKILLQITKPNAQACKYVLNEHMKFSRYWNEIKSDSEAFKFELNFRYQPNGNFIILPNDYHMEHQYGEVVPIFPETHAWLKEYLKNLPITKFIETDPCTFQILALSEFLYLTDIFRSHKIR